MNPMRKQYAIREFELFISGGVHEVPESVFDTETRPAGERKVVREQTNHASASQHPIRRVVIGKVKFSRATGEVID